MHDCADEKELPQPPWTQVNATRAAAPPRRVTAEATGRNVARGVPLGRNSWLSGPLRERKTTTVRTIRHRDVGGSAPSGAPSQTKRAGSSLGAPPIDVGGRPTNLDVTPTNQKGTPTNLGGTPSLLGRRPRNQSVTPSILGRRPTKLGVTPRNQKGTPTNLGGTPSFLGRPPRNQNVTPNVLGRRPTNLGRRPKDQTVPPSNQSRPPRNLGRPFSRDGEKRTDAGSPTGVAAASTPLQE